MSPAVYEIFFNEDKSKRMANVFDYTERKEMIIEYNEKLPNALNYDIGDIIEFDSIYYGWISGCVVSITSAPFVRDEYKIEYTILGGKVQHEVVEGQYMLY